MIKTDFMNLYEELSFLNEEEDPYLRAAMQMFQADDDAKGGGRADGFQFPDC